MPQFFLSPEAVKEKVFQLSGPEAFHITKVLRYREGQELVFFDGQGGRYEAVIDKVMPDGSLTGRVLKTLHEKEGRPMVRLNLHQGLLKAAAWEWVIQKSTELGVVSLVPIKTPRTVVLMRESFGGAKLERWKKIILSACKQSNAARLPELREPQEFRDAIRNCVSTSDGNSLTLLAWEGLSQATAGETLKAALKDAAAKSSSGGLTVNLFIGPEGGFSEEEVELAESLGVCVFGLGAQTLRAETAALTACALVLYELGAI